LSVAQQADGQAGAEKTKISARTNRIVERIEKFDRLKGKAVGRAPIRPREYDEFVKLRKSASPGELKALTDHPWPVVRGYAFWALSYTKDIDLLPIVLDHISDTAVLDTKFGCVGRHPLVGDFFIEVANGWRGDAGTTLDSLEHAVLDSVLLFTPNILEARSDVLDEARPEPARYARIRELVTTEHDQAALVALARYRMEQDVQLIRSNYEESSVKGWKAFVSTFEAIEEFPHPAFTVVLETHLRSSLGHTLWDMEWRPMYRAIANYRNSWALELLRVPFTQVQDPRMRDYHLDFVFDALWKMDDPMYDSLLWKLWGEENRIDLDVLDRLSSRDPDRARGIMRRDLENPPTFHLGTHNIFKSVNSDTLLSIMLDRGFNQDREFGMSIIRKNILDADMDQFDVFTRKIAELRDSSFVEPLFARLQSESNPYFFLKAAEALIVYQDPAIDMRLLVEQKKKPDLLETWAGKELDALLKKNGTK
jgi:hypothetical protein